MQIAQNLWQKAVLWHFVVAKNKNKILGLHATQLFLVEFTINPPPYVSRKVCKNTFF